jgi:lysophospholipase L1-like esterase
VLALVGLVSACGDDSSDGGTENAGGAIGVGGGYMGTGGSISSGGSIGSGGVVGSGGEWPASGGTGVGGTGTGGTGLGGSGVGGVGTGGTGIGGVGTGGTGIGGVGTGGTGIGGDDGSGGLVGGGGEWPASGGTGTGGDEGIGGTGGDGIGGDGTGGDGTGGDGVGGSAGEAVGGTAGTGGSEPDHWVGTWGTSPQLTETSNNPPNPPGLANNTLRQIVYVSIGGSQLRVQISNEFGNGSVTINSVHMANATSGSSIDTGTDVALAFSGSSSVTIPQGQAVYSDPFDFTLTEQSTVAVTMQFGSVPSGISGHPGSRTTSYIATGDAVSSASLNGASTTDHWYYLTRIDVMAPATAAAAVTLGDSITDGRGSTTNGNDRWPDALSRRLRANGPTAEVAVVNAGIGGNAVVSGGLGPTALARFDRDVLGTPGVRWVLVLEGVNDIGGAGTSVVSGIISAYQEFISKAHAQDVLVYGIPILPFGGSQYDSADHETARQQVNDWIRTSGEFDAVLDLDVAVADPGNTTRLLPAYDDGDQLHLSPAGYQAMADAIDLDLFLQ